MDELTFIEYQMYAAKTAIYPGRGTINGLLYAALGLGESGEVQGKVKKILRDASGEINDERRDQIADELGDMLWYVSAMSDEIGVPMNDIAERNIAKLASRQARGVLKGDGDTR